MNLNIFKKATARICPVCRSGLSVKSIQNTLIDICSHCGGSWYDLSELEMNLNTKRKWMNYVPQGYQKMTEGNRLCPICQTSMQTLQSNPIYPFEIDFCKNNHGVWLDKEEMSKISEVVEKNRYSFKKRDDTSEQQAVDTLIARTELRIREEQEWQEKLRNNNPPESKELILSEDDLTDVQKILAWMNLPVESGELYESGAWINLTLILINVTIFIFMILKGNAYSIIHTYGFVPSRVLFHPFQNWMRVFTGMFLHAGSAHLLGNMYFLFLTGDNVENKMGHLKFLLFYLLAGLGASLISLFVNNGSDLPHVGASGAISGVMGAYLVLCSQKRFYIPFFKFMFFIKLISIPAYLYLSFWLMMQVILLKFFNISVDYYAHITGFFIGIGAGCLMKKEN